MLFYKYHGENSSLGLVMGCRLKVTLRGCFPSYLMLLVVAQPFLYWSYLKEYLMMVNDRYRPIEEVIFFLKGKIKIPPSKPKAKPRTRYLVVEQKISVRSIPLSLIFGS